MGIDPAKIGMDHALSAGEHGIEHARVNSRVDDVYPFVASHHPPRIVTR
jgi:hypothetical protein